MAVFLKSGNCRN